MGKMELRNVDTIENILSNDIGTRKRKNTDFYTDERCCKNCKNYK